VENCFSKMWTFAKGVFRTDCPEKTWEITECGTNIDDLVILFDICLIHIIVI
jgi:hypothetical protein